MTVVLITHYMEEAAIADRCIVMEKGKILLDGTPKEVFAQGQTLRQTGLTLPAACELFYRLQEMGVTLSPMPLTEEDCIKAIKALF